MKVPAVLQPLWKGWMAFSHAIGIVMSSVLLTLIWVFVFGAYAVILKIVKVFGTKPHPESFWWDVSKEHSDFEHQF
jgi:hypothetical protein